MNKLLVFRSGTAAAIRAQLPTAYHDHYVPIDINKKQMYDRYKLLVYRNSLKTKLSVIQIIYEVQKCITLPADGVDVGMLLVPP